MTALISPANPGWPDVTRFEIPERLLGGDGGPLNRAPLQLLERTEYLKNKIDDAVSGALTFEYANLLKTPRSIAMTGDGSWVVTFDGSGNVTSAMTLANTGVVAGTYPVVTIDSKGRVTSARALQSADLPANAALSGAPTAPTAELGTNTLQLANTAYVQAAIAALVASSPAALDTLNELAAALGNDANFAATMTNALAGKAALAGSADQVFSVANAIQPQHAVARRQVLAASPQYAYQSYQPASNQAYEKSITFTAPCAGYVLGASTINLGSGMQPVGCTNIVVINGVNCGSDTTITPLTNWGAKSVAAGETVTVKSRYATGVSGGPFINTGQTVMALFIPNP